MIRVPRTKKGRLQWQHTCYFTTEEKEKLEEIMIKEKRTVNGTIRYMIRTYKIEK